MSMKVTLWMPLRAISLNTVLRAVCLHADAREEEVCNPQIMSSAKRGVRYEPVDGQETGFLVVFDLDAESRFDKLRQILRDNHVPFDEHAQNGVIESGWYYYRPGMTRVSWVDGDENGAINVSVERLKACMSRARRHSSAIEALVELSHELDETYFGDHPLRNYA